MIIVITVSSGSFLGSYSVKEHFDESIAAELSDYIEMASSSLALPRPFSLSVTFFSIPTAFKRRTVKPVPQCLWNQTS